MYTSTHKNLTPTMPSHHFSHFYHRMQGGVKRFAYPKEVWSPAGGWWAQPKTWKSNTVVVALGMAVTCAGVWRLSAEREWRHKEPIRWIPSMMWSKQFKSGEFKQDD
ncbi:hypothetical protein BC936DRAFT_137741 [Jimgerdemannia flammicorona]|uniref:Uncharacterized protein n=1 Tax=Jimgerdemannia flammicorona TaxID=994334 RepID=A0A433DMZ9_9FUNG|nr:hypothetical protein BC936DRAFT_137741 [Jimgerdemannia flammicorona]